MLARFAEPIHHGMRWSLCAREMCFRNELLRQFFLNGKTLPVERGQGVDQPIMQARTKSHPAGLYFLPCLRVLGGVAVGTGSMGGMCSRHC